ncbi:MAG: hypothetical protein IT473_14760 [Lysobacter sp.]|nr:hypothetical protein [Lysobacter sp.]
MRSSSSILSRSAAMAATVFVALLIAVSSSPNAAAAGRRTVELELVGPKTYRGDGCEFDYAGIASALAEADAEKAIKKLVLFDPDGETSMGDVIDFALLAKPIGAKAYHKVDGELREIQLSSRP